MTRLRALVVDDEAVARHSLVPLIEATGLSEVIGVVARVDEALALLGLYSVDVVFLEVRLPGGENGLDVIRFLPDEWLAPSFVIVTALDRDTLSGFALGVVDYLLKPVSRARIEHCLRRVMGLLAAACRPKGL